MLPANVGSLCECLVPSLYVAALEISAVVGVFHDAHLDLFTRLSLKMVSGLKLSASQ